jgi:SAM-dependent methyltransferase
MLSRVASRVSLRSRERKLRLFHELLRPGPETTVVDVGVTDATFGAGSTDNFFEALYPWPERITAVSDVPLPHFARAFPQVERVVADGTDLPFEDDAFDIAFSNAVIEHVGGREEQRRFVEELCRVAARVFVSTPNRWFPLETHTLVPLVHWLPRAATDRAMQALRRENWTRIELLGKRDLLGLFPPQANARVVESRITISVAAERLEAAARA